MNSQRIASKIGNPEDFAEGDPTVPGSAVGRKIKMEEVVEENFNELFGNVPEIEQAAEQELGMSSGSTEPESNSYWFTSDHLGSSAFVTDASGVAIQHLEIDRREIREPPLKHQQGREQYMAFGEVFVDQRRTGFGTPYKFNAKELDCESGYYYYGARYYDPRMARFLSVDPLAGDMPEWGSYTYTFNNPLRYIDPTGMGPENIGVDGEGNVVFDDGENDGNLYLVNSGAGEINSLEDLKANSTQLSRNHEWIGSKDQMVNYVKSQWKQSGNGIGHFLSVMDIKIGKNKSGFVVNAFKGRQNSSGEIEENANTLLDNMYLKINYKPDGENHHLSNPYNTRNALTHEKQHLIQGVRHMHRDLGWTPRTRGSKGARELEAIQVEVIHK